MRKCFRKLAKLDNVNVISRTSVARYATTDLSIPQIAAELRVGAVMEGSVRYANDRVRITAQLVDAASDQALWSDVYERDFADVFAIQADIAMNIANALQAEFSVAERQSLEREPTSSPAAYALFLQALSGLRQIGAGRGRDGSWLARSSHRDRPRLRPSVWNEGHTSQHILHQHCGGYGCCHGSSL